MARPHFDDPERCSACGTKARIIDSRNENGEWRRRRRECPHCLIRWSSREMRINPFRLRAKPKRVERADDAETHNW